MTNALGFEALKGILERGIHQLPEQRKAGPNTRYTIKDAVFGAVGVFYTQSSSFLEYQNHLQQTKGQNNACTLFGVEQIPCNNQRRNLLDPLIPSHLNGVYLEVFDGLEQHGLLSNFRVLDHQLLMARNGTQYHASNTMHCQNCLRRQTSKGQTRYYHSAITPVIVCPRRSEAIALPPACIMSQDGHDKQDCERVAGKRWIEHHAKQVAPSGVICLGDDLYSNQPLYALPLQKGCNFIFVCKPDSYVKLYERLTFWQQTHAIKEVGRHHRDSRFTEVMMYGYTNSLTGKPLV